MPAPKPIFLILPLKGVIIRDYAFFYFPTGPVQNFFKQKTSFYAISLLTLFTNTHHVSDRRPTVPSPNYQ
jgi:hypothetical protein